MNTLGKRVRDRVTKFEGTVVQRLEHLYGSAQILVAGHDNGCRRDEWLEEGRCEVVNERPLAAVSTCEPKDGAS